MIVDKLIEWMLGLLGLINDSITLPDPPEWLSNPSAISTVFQALGSMSVWFPTGTVVVIIGAVFAVRLTGLGLKAGRMIVSLFTGGGGNAGGG